MENNWISYIGRSYNVVKANFRKQLPIKLPEFTDYSQSNLLMIILDQVAGLIEVLNFYVDTAARELYVPNARRFSSLLRIAESVNYQGKARITAKADLLITLLNEDGDEVPAPGDILIPMYATFRDTSSNRWLTLDNYNILSGFSKTMVPVIQAFPVENVVLGTPDSSPNQIFELPNAFAHGSLTLEIDGEIWEQVDSFSYSGPTDLHYKITLYTDGKIKAIFGDGVNGKIPTNTSPIIISYLSTVGLGGNTEEDTITTPGPTTYLPDGYQIECSNPAPAVGGYGIEDIEKLRKSIPNSLYTSGRTVTRKDYERVASSAPGIREAKLDHQYPVYPIKLYVVPNLGGIANQALLAATKEFIQEKGLIGPTFDVRPAGVSLIVLKLRVYGSYGSKSVAILTDVEKGLFDLYHPQKVEINKPIYIADIFHALKNLNSVSHLLLDSLYLSPYFRPSVYDAVIDAEVRILDNLFEKEEWMITYLVDEIGTTISVYRGGSIVAELTPTSFGAWLEDVGSLGILDLKINSIITVEKVVNWHFTVYPPNTDVLLDNFSIPVINLSDSEFTIIEKTDG